MRTKSPVQSALEYAAVRLVIATLAHTPLPLARPLSRFYAALLDRAIPRLRRIAYRNLRLAFPNTDPKPLTDGVFHSIARTLLSFARFPKTDPIAYQGFEHFSTALTRGKGVLFATAHLGNWELSAFSHALMTAPMHVVVRPLDNPLIDAFVERRRTLSGNRITGKQDFVRPILKALRNNQAVGILIDQNSGLEGGTFVPFLGTPACVNTGFAKLAWRSGAAVIPGFAVWSEPLGRYILRFYPEVPLTGDAAEDTRAIQATLESAIREYPDQWLWIHRRWKTRPPGEPSLYNDV